MTKPADTELWVALSLIPDLGNAAFRKLLSAFGQPNQIFNTSYDALCKVVKPNIARIICDGYSPEQLISTIDWLSQPDNYIITLADTEYPASLLQISDPPSILYLKGRRDLLQSFSIAVVGSRNATPQGLKNAELFSENLSNNGFCIVSGLATGIDTAAHLGGLKGSSSSLAVVGTGLDIVYPARNRNLAHELAKNGAILSEYALGTPAIASNFPKRNRIISGLTRGCLVVEAALRSGSLITARFAAEHGKEVFAIPGSIHSPLSKGCHALIKQGAKLVESAQDILEELNPGNSTSTPLISPAPLLGEDNHALLAHLGYDACNINVLVDRSGLTPELVSAMLLALELEGVINSLPGGLYQRIV